MSELNVVAVVKAKPGSEGTVRDTLTASVPHTRAEQGCISYSLYESTVDSATFITIEKWDSQADLDKHLAALLAGLTPEAKEALGEAPAVHPLKLLV